MAEAEAKAPVIATMDAYLEQVVGVTIVAMRQKRIQHGYSTFEGLLLMSDKQVDDICGAVRKSGAGNVNARDVPVVIQTRLKWVVMHTKYRYMTQRALEFNNAPLEQLQEVAMWVQQLDDDPEEDTVLV